MNYYCVVLCLQGCLVGWAMCTSSWAPTSCSGECRLRTGRPSRPSWSRHRPCPPSSSPKTHSVSRVVQCSPVLLLFLWPPTPHPTWGTCNPSHPFTHPVTPSSFLCHLTTSFLFSHWQQPSCSSLDYILFTWKRANGNNLKGCYIS